jgi:drug/metabolite transporter (DMT)-like permease
VLAALLTTILFSLSIVCGRQSARLIGGTEANFWRLTTATIFLSVWSFGLGKGLGGTAFPVFLISGIAGIGVGDVALFQTLPRLGSRLSLLLIQCLTAPFGALIEWVWLGTELTTRQVLFGMMIILGVGIGLLPGEKMVIERCVLIKGSLFGILAALGGALGAVLSRKAYAITHAAGEHIDGANAAFQRIVGGLLIGGICLLIVKRREFWVQSRAPAKLVTEVSIRKWKAVWPWVLMNGFAGQTLGVSCMQIALEHLATGVVLAIVATTPLVVIPFTMKFEKEKPTVQSVLGGVIAVVGVVFLVLWR